MKKEILFGVLKPLLTSWGMYACLGDLNAAKNEDMLWNSPTNVQCCRV
jgi:hypothetical protein